jgi:hypothetical protein
MKKQPNTEVRDELKELNATKLLAFKNMDSGLRLPENFFETVQKEVLSKIEKAPVKSAQVRSLNILLRVAVILLLAALALWMLFPQAPAPASELLLASSADMEAYVLENADLFDLETIMEMNGEYANTENPLPNDLTEEELNRYLEEYLEEFDLAILESNF